MPEYRIVPKPQEVTADTFDVLKRWWFAEPTLTLDLSGIDAPQERPDHDRSIGP